MPTKGEKPNSILQPNLDVAKDPGVAWLEVGSLMGLVSSVGVGTACFLVSVNCGLQLLQEALMEQHHGLKAAE